MKLFLFLLLPFLTFTQERPITVEDLWSLKRFGSYDVSPDGKTIVFSATSYSMEENKGNSNIYLINADGSNFREFKSTEKSEKTPKFSPDGKRIAYIFDKQVWSADLNGNNEEEMFNIYSGVEDFDWSNDGKKILFTSKVYPECTTQECIKERDEQKADSKVSASIFTRLMYRHWNEWRGEKRSHLFVYDFDKKEFFDLTLQSKFDVPPISLGSSNDFNFSSDGNEIAFAMNTADFISTSTNNDVFIIRLKDVQSGSKTPYEKISISDGNDNQPVYSPDGKYIAYTSMKRAGFEADQQNIVLYNRQTRERKILAENFDKSVSQFVWSPDSKTIYFTAANEIYSSIYRLDVDNNEVKMILEKHDNSDVSVSPDGSTIYFKQESAVMPEELFAMNLDGSNIRQLTFMNKEILDNLAMNPVETFWSEGAGGTKVQSILLKPPMFDPNKKYPMIFLIHGGPQGHWTDDFHFRWNLQMFASKGYVVVAPNPRGSVGYGQQFTDEISGDWGGKVYTDLMNAYDHALNNFSYIDAKNTFAAGASYGGYMINWIAGHTDRFNALVSHAGVFNLESMYGGTEELWFPEWEFKGTPWENRELYEKWSPHRYIHNAETPMLIIHGAYDFRVPEGQAMELFTSLQRLGVESKFLYFPDENHWITKPQNARLWWNTIFGWFNNYLKTEMP